VGKDAYAILYKQYSADARYDHHIYNTVFLFHSIKLNMRLDLPTAQN